MTEDLIRARGRERFRRSGVFCGIEIIFRGFTASCSIIINVKNFVANIIYTG